jgi:hypothetical protein
MFGVAPELKMLEGEQEKSRFWNVHAHKRRRGVKGTEGAKRMIPQKAAFMSIRLSG